MSADKKKPTILLVEDADFLSHAYQYAFEELDYGVKIANDGKEALEMMRAEAPDLVLLDIVMPKINGFEVLQEMRKEQALKEIPVVVLSNLDQEFEVARAKEFGILEYLTKSNTDIDEVVARVRHHIDALRAKRRQ